LSSLVPTLDSLEKSATEQYIEQSSSPLERAVDVYVEIPDAGF